MNFSQSDLNKISKYTIRLRKSIQKNDNLKINEYYDHLKYHIQLGGNDNNNGDTYFDKTVLTDKFKLLDTLISNLKDSNKGYKTFDNLYNELTQCNKDKMASDEQIVSLNEQIKNLNGDKLSLQSSINELNTIEQKNEQVNDLNLKIKDLNETIQKFKSDKIIIDEIFNKIELTTDDLKKQTKEIVVKISRYDDIINKIKDQLQDIENQDNEKFLSALEELELRLKQSTDLQSQLEKSNTQIDDLNSKLSNLNETEQKLNEVTNQIEELKKSNTEHTNTIDLLNKQIMKLIEEKNSNDKTIDEIANNFDSQLKLLLNAIYGSEILVDNIIDGKSFGDKIK